MPAILGNCPIWRAPIGSLQDEVPPFIIIATAVTYGIVSKKKRRLGLTHRQLTQSATNAAHHIQNFIRDLLEQANEIGITVSNSVAWAIHENGVILGLRKPADKKIRPAKTKWTPGEEIKIGEGLENLAQALIALWKRSEHCQPRAMFRAWTPQLPERKMESLLRDSQELQPRLILILIRAN